MNSKNISPEKIELRKQFPPTFGRRKSRSLSETQMELMKTVFPQIRVSPEDEDIEKFIKDTKGKKAFLEIGFGIGEHVINQAKENLDAVIVACEIFLNSMAVCLNNVHKNKIENVRFYDNDSRYLLAKLPENSLDKVFILFPDPWPKQRQFKRRIVSQATLDLIVPALKKGGEVSVATDIAHYFESMMNVFAKDARFKKSSDKPHANYIQTKYHSKAIREGRPAQFATFTKI